MTSTVTTPGAYDALEKALPGEPLFPLLGHDPDAPATVTEWCRLRRNRALRLYGESSSLTDKELLAAELRQCANAEDIALQMGDWRLGQTAEVALRSSYNDVIKTAEEIAEADRRQRRATAVQHLREAAYHASEARDLFVGLELIGEATQHDLMLMLARINGLAEEYSPKRPGSEPQAALPLTEGAA